MPGSPHLVLVDPRAQRRAAHRARLASTAVGLLVLTASAVPFVLALQR